jgi:hypothetical protein
VHKLLATLDQLPGVNAASYHAAMEWLLRREDNTGFAQACNMLPKLFELESDRAVATLTLIFRRARRQEEDKVYQLVGRLEQLPGDKTAAALFATIDWLLNRDENAGFAKATQMLPKLFELDSEFAVITLTTMFNQARRKQLSTALEFLDAIEADVLAPPPPPPVSEVKESVVERRKKAPIPLSFYNHVLVCVEKEPHNMANLIQRLHRHYDNGWIDLHPDAEMSRRIMYAFYQMNQQTKTGSTIDERVEILDRLIERYELNGRTEEEYKPMYIMFDWAIGDLKERNKKTKVDPGSKDDPYEKDSRKVVKLLEKMHSYAVAPDNAKRSYAYNAAMEMVLSCRNTHMHFKTIMILRRQMVDLGIQPNAHTVIDTLRACERASMVLPRTRKAYWGWHCMLLTLDEARKMGVANQLVYDLCFRVMHANREFRSVQSFKKDEMLERVSRFAIDDSTFDSAARRTFLDLASPALKRRLLDLLERRAYIAAAAEAAARPRPNSKNRQQQKQKLVKSRRAQRPRT